jgi:hypothetical protein
MSETTVTIPPGCKIQLPEDAAKEAPERGEIVPAYQRLCKGQHEPFEMRLLVDTELGKKGDHIEVSPIPITNQKGAYELQKEHIAEIVLPPNPRSPGLMAGRTLISSKHMLTDNVPGLGLAADVVTINNFEAAILGKLSIPLHRATTYIRDMAQRKRPDYKPPQPP